MSAVTERNLAAIENADRLGGFGHCLFFPDHRSSLIFAVLARARSILEYDKANGQIDDHRDQDDEYDK